MASAPVTIRSKKLKRFLFVGPTGAGKSKIINCCYNRKVDPISLLGPADVGEADRLIGRTSSVSNYVNQNERHVYIDTVGYGDARFQTDRESFLLFFRELICHTSVGYNWLFLVLRFESFTLDVLVYVEMLEQLLGKNALSRCTIVFTHCKMKDMDRNKCITANRESQRIVDFLEKAHSIIFGDMDTFEDNDLDDEIRVIINQSLTKRRKCFMVQLLHQIDHTNEDILALNESWFYSYWTNFIQYIGHWTERLFGKSNELSRRYRLAAVLKKEIPVTIYYESCTVCLELIIEIWDTEPTVCVTACGHIFHYECLKRWFGRQKQCPICRTDLRSLPERILGKRVGLHPVSDASEIKAEQPCTTITVSNATASPQAPSGTSPEIPAENPSEILFRSPTVVDEEIGTVVSLEETNVD